MSAIQTSLYLIAIALCAFSTGLTTRRVAGRSLRYFTAFLVVQSFAFLCELWIAHPATPYKALALGALMSRALDRDGCWRRLHAATHLLGSCRHRLGEPTAADELAVLEGHPHHDADVHRGFRRAGPLVSEAMSRAAARSARRAVAALGRLAAGHRVHHLGAGHRANA